MTKITTFINQSEGNNTFAVFYKSNLKSAKTYKSPRVLPSRKTVYSGISKLIMQCPYSFHMLCNIIFNLNFHIVLFMFPFPFCRSDLKVCTVHSSNSSLFCKRSIIGQLNIPADQLKMKSNTPTVTYYTLDFKILTVFEVFFDKH